MAKKIKLTTANVAENKVFANDDLRRLLFTFVFDVDRWKKKKNLVLEELKRGFRDGFVLHHPYGLPFSPSYIDDTWQPVTINLTSHNEDPRHLRVMPSIWCRRPGLFRRPEGF